MIFLFTGEEKYLIDSKIIKRKKAFTEKYGSLNIYDFGEGSFDLHQIQQSLMGGGLFDDKKLIIIRGVPKDSFTKINSSLIEKTSDFIEKNIDSFNKNDVIVFVSYKPDKRTKSFKFLSKHKCVKHEEYKLFTEKKLISYVQKIFSLDEETANHAVSKIGTNLFNIHNELSKILKVSNKIDKNLLDKYVNTNIQQDSFELLDNINNTKKSISILKNLQHNSEDFFKILGLLYWNIKNIILILEQKSLGTDSKDISSKLSIHPFVVMKILKNHKDSNLFSMLLGELLGLDFKIKTGQVDGSLAYLYLKKIFLEIK